MSTQLSAVFALAWYALCVFAAWRIFKSNAQAAQTTVDRCLYAVACVLIGAFLFVNSLILLFGLLVLVCLAFGIVP